MNSICRSFPNTSRLTLALGAVVCLGLQFVGGTARALGEVLPPTESELAKTQAEVQAVFQGVLEEYREHFAPDLEKLRQQGQDQKIIAQCSSPEHSSVFADGGATPGAKLAAVAEEARGLLDGRMGRTVDETRKMGRLISICVGVALASGHEWAGAVWVRALVSDEWFYGEGNPNAGGDLLAAYYGSGVLGATDMAEAKKALAAAKQWIKTIDKKRTLDMLDMLDGTAFIHALYGEAATEQQEYAAQLVREAAVDEGESPDQWAAERVEPCQSWSFFFASWRESGMPIDLAARAMATDLVPRGDVPFDVCLFVSIRQQDVDSALAFAATFALPEYRTDSGLSDFAALEAAILLGSGLADPKGEPDLAEAVRYLEAVTSVDEGFHARAERLLKYTRPFVRTVPR